jgi:hypothetical protein
MISRSRDTVIINLDEFPALRFNPRVHHAEDGFVLQKPSEQQFKTYSL